MILRTVFSALVGVVWLQHVRLATAKSWMVTVEHASPQEVKSSVMSVYRKSGTVFQMSEKETIQIGSLTLLLVPAVENNDTRTHLMNVQGVTSVQEAPTYRLFRAIPLQPQFLPYQLQTPSHVNSRLAPPIRKSSVNYGVARVLQRTLGDLRYLDIAPNAGAGVGTLRPFHKIVLGKKGSFITDLA
jgi:hypothetical protein